MQNLSFFCLKMFFVQFSSDFHNFLLWNMIYEIIRSWNAVFSLCLRVRACASRWSWLSTWTVFCWRCVRTRRWRASPCARSWTSAAHTSVTPRVILPFHTCVNWCAWCSAVCLRYAPLDVKPQSAAHTSLLYFLAFFTLSFILLLFFYSFFLASVFMWSVKL